MALFVALMALTSPQKALSCSIPPPLPMTDAERELDNKKHEQEILDWVRGSEAVVRIEVLTSSGYGEGSALIEVKKTLHGKMQRGKVLRLKTIDTGLCGWGDLKRGQRGTIVLDRERPRYFKGFLDESFLQHLQTEGILPAKI